MSKTVRSFSSPNDDYFYSFTKFPIFAARYEDSW